jgi:NADH dehydrogenase FAD-containing subunit
VQVLLAEARIDAGRISPDIGQPLRRLIIATGATHAYGPRRGRPSAWLKTLEDGPHCRHLLLASNRRDARPCRPSGPATTFVIVGGPMGVELAGALANWRTSRWP